MSVTAEQYLALLHNDQSTELPGESRETSEWAEDFLRAIRLYRDGRLDKEAQNSAMRFGKSSTKDEYRFIWELWQNADDARASTLRFVIRKGELCVENDGRPLSSRDVYSMCFIASSQKAGDITQKGQFGIGLLSLMRVCGAPAVHSGPFHFRLERSFTYPNSIAADGGTEGTRVVAVLEPKVNETDLYNELVRRADDEVLLYMTHLRRVEVVHEDTGESHSIECASEVTENGARIVRLGGHTWRKYAAEVHPPSELQREDGETVPSSIQIVMARSDTVAPPHRLASFFPTTVEHGLPWRFSAPFEVTNSREQLIDSGYNRWLFAEVGRVMVDAALDPKVGDSKTPWKLVPGADVEEGELRPIYEAAHEKLKDLEWIPTIGGLRRPADVAIPASGELKRLIKPPAIPDDEVSARVWIRTKPDEAGRRLLLLLDAYLVCCHELSEALAIGPAREAPWYLSAAAEVLSLVEKTAYNREPVFERLRLGKCFKDQRNRSFSLADAENSSKVVCNARGELLAKELARLASPWIVMLHPIYRESRAKREQQASLSEARKRVGRWLADQSDAGAFSYEHSLEAPQFIEHFIVEADEARLGDLSAQTEDVLVSFVRDHMKAYVGRYRPTDDHLRELGRRIRVETFAFGEDGTRINDRRSVTETYLGKSYTKSPWAIAAAKTPGLHWISSKYKRTLQRTDDDGVLAFLRSLGAADRPRVLPKAETGSHGNRRYSPVTHGDTIAYPHFPHDSKLFGWHTAYGTRGDHESADIDRVLTHLATMPDVQRRLRAEQLYRSLEQSWDTLEDASRARAFAYGGNSETPIGSMPARWIYNLQKLPWMRFTDGSYRAPQSRFAAVPSVRAVLGSKDPDLSAWECARPELADALEMLTVVPSAAIVKRLRRFAEHDATLAPEKAGTYYEALSAAAGHRDESLSPLLQESLIYYPTKVRKWWTANLALQKNRSDIFSGDRAYLNGYTKAKALWNFLGIEEDPSLQQLADWWRSLIESAPSTDMLNRLERSYVLADESCREHAGDVVPVWTNHGWRPSNTVVTTSDEELWSALSGRDLCRWDQPHSERLADFCRWSGITILENHADFGQPSLTGDVRVDDTLALHFAIKSHGQALSRVNPELWKKVAPLARRWTQIEVVGVPLLEVPTTLRIPGSSPTEVTVRRHAALSGDRLTLTSLTKITSVEAVRCLLKAARLSPPDSMQVEEGLRIRLLEGPPLDIGYADALPDIGEVEEQEHFDTEDAGTLLSRYARDAENDAPEAPVPPAFNGAHTYVVISDLSPNTNLPVGGQVPTPTVNIKPPSPGGQGRRPRQPTQRAALSVEQHGVELYIQHVLGPAGITISDERLNKGVGADLVCSDGVFRELKTSSGPAPDGLKLSAHEHARASEQGSRYELVVVECIADAPVITVIPNPLECLKWHPVGDVRVTGWRDATTAGRFRHVRLRHAAVESEPSE